MPSVNKLLKTEGTNGRPLSPIIIFNGPPGSGKDESYNQIEPILASILFSTSESLKLATLSAFGLLEMEITIDEMEKTKNNPNPLLDGLTWREAQIRVAENLKSDSAFGQQFWTKTLVRKIKAMDDLLDKSRERNIFFVTGMGFPVELAVFEDDEELRDRCLLVRLKREGKTFGKKPGFEEAYGPNTGFDSRNYLFSDKIHQVELDNSLGLKEYRHDLLITLNEFFAIKKFAINRNDPIMNTAILSKKRKNVATGDIVPFAKPYKVIVPKELNAAA